MRPPHLRVQDSAEKMRLRKQHSPAISDRAAVGMDFHSFLIFSVNGREKKASFLLFLPPVCMQQQAAGAESMPVLLCQVWHCQGSVLLGFSREQQQKKKSREREKC